MRPPSERTPLQGAGAGAPVYVFAPAPSRSRRARIRHFQCCVCAALLACFVVALVVTVAYSINRASGRGNGTQPDAQPDVQQQLQALLALSWPLPEAAEESGWPQPAVEEQLERALEAGRSAAARRRSLEAAMPALQVDSPSYRHQQAVATGRHATQLAEAGFVMAETARYLAERLPAAPHGLGPRITADWQPQDTCAAEASCSAPPSPWRPPDGRCNGAAGPARGAAMRPFRRSLPPDYADGVGAPRAGAAAGRPLPSAREVSVTVHRPLYRDDRAFSVMLAVWGQFIDHDITATALSRRSTDGGAISCCYALRAAGLQTHPECFPVLLAPQDPYFHLFNVSCMEFVRSAPAPACRLGPREQLNQATSFLDGSVVYGSSAAAAARLRAGAGGRLRMLRTADGRELLPTSTDPADGCNRADQAAHGRYCFATGDARANENLHLTTMHLLWARQHNRLADGLAELNPHWGDERLFQEARRILAAQMQHITFNEFVPIIIGRNLTEKLQLSPRAEGYADDYNPDVDPTVANVFAAAAFRFAHTLLPGLMKLITNDTSSPEYVELHELLFNPFALYAADGEEAALRGSLEAGLLRFDPHFSSQVTEHLFERPAAAAATPAPTAPAPCGLDLVSLNIQRGRDHGLPAYPLWRRLCGLSRPRSFADLRGVLDPDSLERIAAIYGSVDDVDAYTGMLSEVPAPGHLLGPTLTCLLTDQFVRLRRGDRYWFETGERPQAFTPAQLREVRRTSLAQVLCDTSQSVTQLQRWVLRAPGADNPRLSCASLSRPDLSAWRDSDPGAAAQLARVAGAGPRPQLAPAAGPRPGPGPAIDPGTPEQPRPLRLGARVLAGRVTTAAGPAWAGELPLALPADALDPDPAPTGPQENAHAVLWSGSLAFGPGRFATLSGRAAVPLPAHGRGQRWLDTDLELQLEVVWASAAVAGRTVRGSFSCPVRAGARERYSAPAGAAALRDVSGAAAVASALSAGPALPRAPLLLLGAYSADGARFLWSGNLTLELPGAGAAPVGSLWAEDNGVPWLPRGPQVESLSEEASLRPALGVTVAAGNISASNGSASQWWSGRLPLAIPLPARPGPGHRRGGLLATALWSGALTAAANATFLLQGNFSLPELGRQLRWTTGNFSFNFTVRWLSPLEGAFSPGQNYCSPVYFRVSKSAHTPSSAVRAMLADSDLAGDPDTQFVAETLADVERTPRAPVILHGSFSRDRTHFLWWGNATVVLPARSPGPVPGPGLSSAEPRGPHVAVGAKVVGGSVVAAPSGPGNASAWWGGQLPAPLPSSVLGRAVTWTGQLTAASDGEALLAGEFSLLGPGGGGLGGPLAERRGKFAFQLRLLWNASLAGLLPAGSIVRSPFRLRGCSPPDDSDAWFSEDPEPGLADLIKVVPEQTGTAMSVPVVLQGAFSADLATFWWSGRAVLVFPSPKAAAAPAAAGQVRAELPAQPAAAKRRWLGAEVTAGAVVAANGTQLWSGALPAALTPALGPASWNGSLSVAPGRAGRGGKPLLLATGQFRSPGTAGTFSFRLSPLWRTRVAGLVVPGVNYTSPFQLLGPGQAAPAQAPAPQEVPVILKGVFLPDKSAFLWAGKVFLSFPPPAA